MKEKSPAQDHDCPSSRRGFLFKLGVFANVVGGALVGIPVLGYVFSSFRKTPELAWIDLGPLDAFPEGKTSLASYVNPIRRPWDGKTAEIPCWVRRIAADSFQVFAINCTHLGCPVRWFQESRLFMCPCHGGVYYEDGEHASGPPPRALYQYEASIRDGRLFVRGGVIPTLARPL